MELDILMLLALICSAVFQINLLRVVAVFDLTYGILHLLWTVYCAAKKGKRKRPSSSTQRDGQVRRKRT